MSSNNSGSNNNNNSGDPMAWLGLLKWSLNYVDGTSDASSNNASPMSDEDKEFLEKVMKEGIIDENERMKFILQEATKAIENNFYCSNNNNDDDDDEAAEAAEKEQEISTTTTTTVENLEELLQELRDIVEQIDYARAFCSLKGLPFLLGCISSLSSSQSSSSSSSSSSETTTKATTTTTTTGQEEKGEEPTTTTTATTTMIPLSIRVQCTAILSTVAQNNPHVQKELLELGACKTLSDVFFEDNTPSKLKIKIMQAMSSIVRNNPLAEQVFCNLQQSPAFILEGLQLQIICDNDSNNNNNNLSASSLLLQSKTLFFLKALLTADDSTSERVKIFHSSVYYIIDHYLLLMDDNNNNTNNVNNSDLREMAISMLEQLLQRGLFDIMSVDDGTNKRKDALVAKAVQRIANIRGMTDGSDEKEFAQLELESWESFLVVLARK